MSQFDAADLAMIEVNIDKVPEKARDLVLRLVGEVRRLQDELDRANDQIMTHGLY